MLKRIFTSLLILSVMYLLVNIWHTGVLKIAGDGLGYHTKVSFAKVDLSPKDYTHWNTLRVLSLYALPLLFLLVVAGIILFSLKNRDKENSLARFASFWLMVWCVALNVSQLAITPFGMMSPESNPAFQDFSVVAVWFGIPVILMLVLGITAIGVSVLIGFISANYFFSCADSVNEVRDADGRRFWLITMFYIPVILSIPLSVLCSYPDISITHLLMSGCAIFVGVGMNLYSEMRHSEWIPVRQDITNRFSLDFLVLFIILVVGIRLFIQH